MEIDEARARMREIQRIMETATLFTLLPGTAAVIGGVLVFLGCGASYWFLNSFDFAEITRLSVPGRVTFCLMWFTIALASVAVNVLLTVRLAARQRIALNPRPAQVAMFALTPCVVVASVLTFQFLMEWQSREIRYIAPVWLMLYGTGVYTAGLFSIRAPRVLGLAFLLMGIVALLCFPCYGVISVGMSFGLLHVMFGAYVLRKQRQVAAQ
ncbi:MAG: hypothetical protein ABSG53_21290 [Thermoguttaceae bacterium]|jgi:uncharacterized membrane protein YwzB